LNSAGDVLKVWHLSRNRPPLETSSRHSLPLPFLQPSFGTDEVDDKVRQSPSDDEERLDPGRATLDMPQDIR
jgi:hypothetical protein